MTPVPDIGERSTLDKASDGTKRRPELQGAHTIHDGEENLVEGVIRQHILPYRIYDIHIDNDTR